MKKKHLWRARLFVAIAMLVLAFVGMVVTQVNRAGGWDYWKWMVPVYAILALGLSFYTKKHQETLTPIGIGHEALHWAGLIGAIFLISYMAHLGVMSRFVASIVHEVLLGLAVFLAGIYIEPVFLIVGVLLAGLALCTAVTVEYLYASAVPILILGAIAISIWIWISHRKAHPRS